MLFEPKRKGICGIRGGTFHDEQGSAEKSVRPASRPPPASAVAREWRASQLSC